MTMTTTWRLVPSEPDQDWTDAFAARGPRIGSFGATIRAVLATAPAPGFALVPELQAIRAALAFLPTSDAAVSGLDRIIGKLDGAPDHMPATEARAPVEQQDEALRQAVMDAIAAALAAPPPSGAAPQDLDTLRKRATSWSLVCRTLDEVAPGWSDSRACGKDCASAAIRMLADQRRAEAAHTPLLTYVNQPTDNVIAWRIGEACSKAARASAGDYIDRGLVLLKELQAEGYGIAALPAQPQAQMESESDA